MRIKLLAMSTLLLLTVSASPLAEIYKWTDKNGKVHFTDNPPNNQQVEKVEVKINTYTAVEIKPLVERLGRKDKVVLYTAAWCGYCKKAKKHFQKKRIDYVAYDVEKSSKGKRDYKLLNAKSVPIIIIGDKRMNGFSSTQFDKLYAQQMKKAAESESSKEGV